MIAVCVIDLHVLLLLIT